jgi:hypothetical protein
VQCANILLQRTAPRDSHDKEAYRGGGGVNPSPMHLLDAINALNEKTAFSRVPGCNNAGSLDVRVEEEVTKSLSPQYRLLRRMALRSLPATSFG